MLRAAIIVFLLTVEPAVDIGLWVSRGQHHHLPVFLLLIMVDPKTFSRGQHHHLSVFLLLLLMVVDLKTEVEIVLLEIDNVLFLPCRSFLIL